jgi:hypothetical protein
MRDLNVPRRTLAAASAENAAAEDLLIKISRWVDVGDGDEMCDGKPVALGHLIAFLFDSYAALIDDSKSDEQCSSGGVAHTCLIFRRHQRKTAERKCHPLLN